MRPSYFTTTSPVIPGCTVQTYSNVPRALKSRETTVSATMLMSAGAPGGEAPKIALWPVPSVAREMLKRTVLPTPTVTENGLNTLPGVKTSTVVGAGEGGAVSCDAHAASATMRATQTGARQAGLELVRSCSDMFNLTLA